MPKSNPATVVGLALSVWLTGVLGATSAHGLDVGYACEADANTVFGVAREAAQLMSHWRSLRIIERERTVKAVVRGWRTMAVPVWIRVRVSRPGTGKLSSELHVMWEQVMEPLNYPDLRRFMELFGDRQRARGLGCVALGTGLGL